MGPCPAPEQLRQLLADQLTRSQGEALEAHLQACPRCQQALERLTGAAPGSPARGGARVPPAPGLDLAAEATGANFLRRLERKPLGHVRPAPTEQTQTLRGVPPAPAAPAAPAVPTVIAGYELLAELGRGGMGVVYKARQVKLRRVVALKVIRKERLTTPDAIRRFRREIQAAAQLSHPNVVRAYDAGEAQGTHFFAMEYVEGADLAQLLRQQGRLPVDRACDYIRQAALGLQHAFEHGLVHRDIKPQNLLLTTQGVLKVADLGLARLREAAGAGRNDRSVSETLTEEGMLMGTPDYLAPEQAQDARSVDIRADLYSLGCTLYQLLAGRVPFPGGTVLDKMFRHLTESPASVQALRPEVPCGVVAVVDKLLAKRPEDRYQSPAEVAEALAEVDLASGGAAAEAATLLAGPASAPAAVPQEPSRGSGFSLPGTGDTAAPGDAPWRLRREAERRRRLAYTLAGSVVLLGLVAGLLVVVLRPGHRVGSRARAAGGQVPEAGPTPQQRRPKVSAADKAFARWLRAVARLPAAKQVQAVASELKKRNPGFDGKVTPRIDKGVVTELVFLTDNVTDISPVCALVGLKSLTCAGSAHGRGKLSDLTPLKDLQLTYLGCRFTKVSGLAALKGMPLTSLDCGYTQVSDLAPLKRMSLTALLCPATPVSELSPLKAMKLTDLDCAGTKVADLAPLKEMKLTTLNCGNTRVSTLTPLKDMKLTYLVCSGTQVAELAPLRGMPLTHLDCYGTNVSDLAPLKDMKLTHLYCANTKVTDLSPVKDMKLTYVDCQSTKVSDLSALKDMKLTTVYCNDTQVSDLSPLKDMKLKVLYCYNTQVSDLSPLKGMKLTSLHCTNTKVADLSPLKDMKLTDLDISGTQVSDLSPLKNMMLTGLSCNLTQVSDLSPLKNMKLTSLVCGASKVTDLSPLKNMKLTELRCSSTKVSELSPLRGMPLTALDCSDTQVSDLSPLKGMKLTQLWCGSTKASDLAPLKGMPLTQLYCQSTKVSDLAPLKGMPLTVLVCSGTKVHELSPLKGMKLTSLNCNSMKVTDLSPLKGMPLQQLYCDFKPDRDAAILRSIKTLETINGKPARQFWKEVDEKQKEKKR